MTGKDNRPGTAAQLHRRAEEIAREKAALSPGNLETLSSEETRRTLLELRVHQIELEMQNEELRTTQAELETAQAERLRTQQLQKSESLNRMAGAVAHHFNNQL